jgi:putative tricarboxylic transport membrane protein
MLLKIVDTWLSVLFLAISLVIYVTAAGYDAMPGRFPEILAVVLALLSVLLFLNAVIKNRAKAKPEAKAAPGAHYVMPGLVTLGMAGYALALDFVGFIVPSVVLMFYVGWALGYRRSGLLLLVSLIFVLIVYGIFGLLLGVPLPRPPFME